MHSALFVDTHVTHQVHAPFFGSRKITIGCLRYDLCCHFLRTGHLFVFVFISVCISVQWSGDPSLLSWAQYGLLAWTGRGRAFWASDDKTRQWEHGNRFRSGPITKLNCPTPIPIQCIGVRWGTLTLWTLSSLGQRRYIGGEIWCDLLSIHCSSCQQTFSLWHSLTSEW